MPIVDEKRVIGNYGTNLVAHILSKFCLVRPVAEGTDIGIDLYCETVVESQPFLHFWVQVKSGSEKIRISDDKNQASFSFKVDHLRYWERQPVPVFAFLVSLEHPPTKPKNIYVVNLSEYFIYHSLPEQEEKTIDSTLKIGVEDDQGWCDLLFNRLPIDSAWLKVKHGVIGSLPELEEGYVKAYLPPTGVSKNYAKRILHTIRTTVGSVIDDAVELKIGESLDPEPEIKIFLEIARIFETKERPEILRALAKWEAFIESNPKKANNLLEEAIRVINKDQNPRLDTSTKQNWIKEIKQIQYSINEGVFP